MSGSGGIDDSTPEGETTAGRGTPMAVRSTNVMATVRTIAVFLAGPVIWSLHFLLVYLVVEAGCTGAGPGLDVFEPPVPTTVTLAATAVAAVACLGTAVWGFRLWRAAPRPPVDGHGLEPVDRNGTMAFAGFVLSLLGVVQVLFIGLPALVLPAC